MKFIGKYEVIKHISSGKREIYLVKEHKRFLIAKVDLSGKRNKTEKQIWDSSKRYCKNTMNILNPILDKFYVGGKSVLIVPYIKHILTQYQNKGIHKRVEILSKDICYFLEDINKEVNINKVTDLNRWGMKVGGKLVLVDYSL